MDSVFEEFKAMYQQIKIEEASLPEKMEVSVSFEDSAIDEIISQAIEKDEEAGALAYQLAKKLESGEENIPGICGCSGWMFSR